MAGVINNRNNTYQHNEVQENKNQSVLSSKNLVEIIQEKFLNINDVRSCEQYEPDEKLRISGAPAVQLPSGKLVIAPDLKCTLENGKVFWVEVKDKCQRFYKPDTGADLHQVLGFYQINNELNEPVLMVFQDASLNDCSVENAQENLKQKFRQKWDLFAGKPYGGWLSHCLRIDEIKQYPLIAFEKSRAIPIFIFYFYIYNLELINFDDILDTMTKDKDHLAIAAYKKNKDEKMELCDKEDLIELSIENLTLITSPRKKYWNTPIVDVDYEDLEVLAEHKKSKYKEEAKKELLKRNKNK